MSKKKKFPITQWTIICVVYMRNVHSECNSVIDSLYHNKLLQPSIT